MWSSLHTHWQSCFEEAWESYCKGSFPIGAVITDENGIIISKGRNKVYENAGVGREIYANKIAHAEVNAILKIDNRETNINRKEYTLYSTMEPCPMCFGAAVMSGLRRVVYAAKDGMAGCTDLKDANPYLESKAMVVTGPFKELEIVQIVLKTVFVLNRGHLVQELLESWRKDCPMGVEIGEKWFEDGVLEQVQLEQKGFGAIFNRILTEIHLTAS
ncbi:nucleoside deaminase [Falsibacillus albus]|uniref:Nucleoside deaminase n=1 Tax=Falsibacillus albus TaxID=2478915 RepID=A0A3L7JSV3_9BACI|nr:nucleoside deaminase [Falsibacillus albus]RLQ93345.1 nucleoside deaminase [Falsibacillus albus]